MNDTRADNPRPDGRDPLDRNVDRLLDRAEPGLAMPDARKRAVLSALRRDGRARRIAPRALLSAAAALVALIAFLVITSGPNGGIVWADVARHFQEIRTLIAETTIEETRPGEETTVRNATIYFKDPGKSRTEFLHDGVPELINILVTSEDEIVDTRIDPEERTIRRLVTRRSSLPDGSRPSAFQKVAEIWTRMKEIASDDTRKIGEREIAGAKAVGFEASMSEVLSDAPEGLGHGTLKVWVNAETGIPVAVDVEFRGPDDTVIRHRHERFEWNAPISDDLFEIPAGEDWKVEGAQTRSVTFTRNRFRDGVTLRFGRDGEPPVVTENDVESIHGGEVVTQGDVEPTERIHITVTLEASAGERLRAYTRDHLGETMVLDFNGEIRIEATIHGIIDRLLLIDIGPLGIPLEEFEKRYLAPAASEAR